MGNIVPQQSGSGGDASAANQTSGAQKTQIVDAGGEQATVTGGRLDVNATVTPSGTQNVDVVANTIGLATQATLAAVLAKIIAAPSTEAKQDALNALITTLNSIVSTSAKQDTLLAELQLKADLTETQPVSLASVPLPTGAATSANQATEIASLASIDAGIPAALGQATMANSMPVVVASNQTAIPVSGTVTVDTSLLATAANQATEIASLSVLDDWDETDRAKVNLIVGQAGIAAGTGVDGATVPRVSLATNVPLPAGTNNIGDVDIVSGTITAVTSITNPVTVIQPTAANLNVTEASAATILTTLNNIDAGTAAALGQTTMAASVPVTMASNQPNILTHDTVLDDVIGTVGAAAPSKVVLIGAIDASGNVREPLLLNTNNDAQPATDIALLTSDRLFGFNGTTWDRLRIDGSDNLQVNVNSSLPAGSNIIGRVGIDQTTPGTTNKVSLSDTAGQAQYNFPAGFQRTTDEPRQLFYDPFDHAPLDYINKWKSPFVTDGAVDAVISGGLVIESTTTASAASSLESLPTFIPPIPGWLGISFAIQLEAVPITNANRFWGIGTSPTSPTATAPLTNAVGFELYTDGKLYAVVYASGVRTVIADLSSSGTGTQPLDGLPHRYIIYYRTDRTFFYFDSLATAVATTNFQSPTIQVLPVKFHAIANSTPPASSAVLTCLGMAVWDTAKNNSTISDGTNPFYRAKVNYDGELSVLAGVTAGKNAPYDITGERALNIKSNELRQTQEEILIQSYAIYMREFAGGRGYELR